MKLLIIDDNPLDRQAIIRNLKLADWTTEIFQAGSATEGITSFEKGHFDLVLLDYKLPDLDGLETLRLIVKNPHHSAAVIIITGGAEDLLLEQEFIEAGAQDVLFKAEISHRHLARAIIHARSRHLLEQQLLESNRQLRSLAESDALTGLTNRHFFDDSLRAAVSRAKRQSNRLALIFIDLDNFKMINDSLGHDAGDELLREFSKRLLCLVRDGDIVCRLGGDEFAILAYDVDSEESIIQFMERILADLRRPIILNGNEYSVSASIGVATYPNAGLSAGDLLKAADLAMYRAKRSGKNAYHFFSTSLQSQVQERMQLERELRSVIPTDHFILQFQPLINAQTLDICGAESLVRWQHPTRGVLPPSEFIGLAEEIGLIVEIDTRSRLKAMQQLAAWRQQKLVPHDFVMHVNVCAQLLNEPDLPSAIQTDLLKTELPGNTVSIEITESVLIENFEQTAELLNSIKILGVKIAVDDFGTGYSSMMYLKALPAGTLKIDRTFVMNVPENPDATRILRAMIVFGKTLNLTVVVEGIETLEQALLCRECGADFFQGYFFAKPLNPEQFAELIKSSAIQQWKHAFLQKTA